MQIRVIHLQGRNRFVGVLLLAVVLALLAFVVTAGLALVAGAAVLGGGALLLRRLFGGKNALPRRARTERVIMTGEEVFPPVSQGKAPRLTRGDVD